jgi:agmatinase
MPSEHKYKGEVPLHEHYGAEAKYAVEAEALLPTTKHEEEIARGLELGLPGADSIKGRRIPTFSRGELPHFAGINTFLKSPYVEDVNQCGKYNVAVLGAPFDGGTTYRSGTRFGPQGIRKISALYGPYSFELGVDLRETISICDLGDVFVIPGNIEKTFDQVSKAVSSTSTGTLTRKTPIWTSACIQRHGFTPPTSRMCRPRIWCRSGLAAGSRRDPASRSAANAAQPS